MSDVVLCVLLVLTALQQDFPEPFVCWQEGPGLRTVGTGPLPSPRAHSPGSPPATHGPFSSVTLLL